MDAHMRIMHKLI